MSSCPFLLSPAGASAMVPAVGLLMCRGDREEQVRIGVQAGGIVTPVARSPHGRQPPARLAGSSHPQSSSCPLHQALLSLAAVWMSGHRIVAVICQAVARIPD